MPPFYIPTDRIEYKKSPNLYNPLSLAFGDPYAEDVVLYLKGDGANLSKSYIDSSPSGGNTITGNASSYITTAEKKYGTASIYRSNVFSMSGANLFFNTGDFTVEFWIRGISLSDNNYRSIITIGGAILFAYGNPMYLRIGSTDHITPFNHNITSTQWAHIAMVQGGATFKVFVNGVEKASGSRPPFSSSTTILLGDNGNFHWIDSLRVTKAARYLNNFDAEESTFLSY